MQTAWFAKKKIWSPNYKNYGLKFALKWLKKCGVKWHRKNRTKNKKGGDKILNEIKFE